MLTPLVRRTSMPSLLVIGAVQVLLAAACSANRSGAILAPNPLDEARLLVAREASATRIAEGRVSQPLVTAEGITLTEVSTPWARVRVFVGVIEGTLHSPRFAVAVVNGTVVPMGGFSNPQVTHLFRLIGGGGNAPEDVSEMFAILLSLQYGDCVLDQRLQSLLGACESVIGALTSPRVREAVSSMFRARGYDRLKRSAVTGVQQQVAVAGRVSGQRNARVIRYGFVVDEGSGEVVWHAILGDPVLLPED